MHRNDGLTVREITRRNDERRGRFAKKDYGLKKDGTPRKKPGISKCYHSDLRLDEKDYKDIQRQMDLQLELAKARYTGFNGEEPAIVEGFPLTFRVFDKVSKRMMKYVVHEEIGDICKCCGLPTDENYGLAKLGPLCFKCRDEIVREVLEHDV